MSTSIVTITFGDSYIHLSDMSYAAFDRSSGRDPYARRCIDGSHTGCNKCVGYCTYYEHRGFLTKELRKQHDCLKKGCRYYVNKEKSSVSSEPAFCFKGGDDIYDCFDL